MTHCPGRSTTDLRGRGWRRNLAQDVAAIREAGFSTVLTLLPDDELARFGVADLGIQVQQAGLQWLETEAQHALVLGFR